MNREDITDPRIVPRWVEAGVSGVPRAAEWDYSLIVAIPELVGSPEELISFGVLRDGSVVPGEGAETGPVVDRLAAQLTEQLAAPFQAAAIRQSSDEWFLGGRRANLYPVTLPAGLDAAEITVAVGLDGARSVLVDGAEQSTLEGDLAAAADTLEEQGLSRHDAFVARAEHVGGGWKLTVDPL